MKQKKTHNLKHLFALGITIFFLSLQGLFGQNRWIQVPSPNKSFVSFDVFGETYYKMPAQLRGITDFFVKDSKQEIRLPNEKGEEEIFVLTPTPLLSKKLAAKYPNLKTFKGVSKSRPDVRLRMSTQLSGVNVWIKIKNGNDFFIQPVRGEKRLHFSYIKFKNDFSSPLFCKTQAASVNLKREIALSKRMILNNQIRTFRIAIAGTGEFTSYWGDDDDDNGSNQEDALAAVVSTLNRINEIFEQDLNIRLELVSDASLLFEDSSNDPFSGNFTSEIQNTLDAEIGDEGYDLGHLFDFGEPDGDAGFVGCICISGKKGSAYATHPFVDVYGGEYRNDYFDLDYAGHEIGHQFGAFHTFAYDTEGTGVNSEPGSGSTIMGYAGLTGVDDLQKHGDAYFHYHSIKNILDYLDNVSCSTNTLIETDFFTIDAGPDHIIPIGTAYELNFNPIIALEGSYTYCWEQLDSAEITSDNFGPNNVTGAMARSLPPSIISKRIIPNINRIISNNLTQVNPSLNSAWETVPLVGRTLNWGLTVRKQTSTFNRLAQDAVKINASASAGPFIINSQNESNYLVKGGAVELIQWDVANTDKTPIGESEVVISMSTDGGVTFPISLADGVPNNGNAKVIIPNSIDTTKARIKVKSKNGIFFALNNVNFSIKSRDLVLNFDPYTKENCDSDTLRYTFNILRRESFNDSFSLQLNLLPSSLEVQFSKEVYTSSETKGFIDLIGLSNLDPINYKFNLETLYGSTLESFAFELKQRNTIFSTITLQSPPNSSQDISLNPKLDWESSFNVDNYRVQLSTDLNFSNILLDQIINDSEVLINDLSDATLYFWRIQQINNCGISDFSEVYSFKTSSIYCTNLYATDLPKNLLDATQNGEGSTLSSINVNFDSQILDVNVLVDLTHTWLEDLSLYLETPAGNQFLLSSAFGGEEDNYTQTIFDQEASENIKDGTAPFTGRFVPVQDINSIYGTSSQGIWKLIVLDKYIEDTGRLLEFELIFCLEGMPEINSDNDSLTDKNDNCPEITNENQADIDNNNIGDLCDIFSSQNLSLQKKDTTCPNKDNGSLVLNSRADYLYRAIINGPNNFQDEITFTNTGYTLNNLAPGNYDLCIFSESFNDFKYCFQTQISAPDELRVEAVYDPSIGILNLEMFGSDFYKVSLNNKSFELTLENSIQLPLTQKINRVEIKTDKICQGIFEEWINLDSQAKVFPNPVLENANILLPRGGNVDLNLFSGSGEVHWTQKKVIEKQESILIPMNNLPRGWYVLQIDYGSYIETQKLLKE